MPDSIRHHTDAPSAVPPHPAELLLATLDYWRACGIAWLTRDHRETLLPAMAPRMVPEPAPAVCRTDPSPVAAPPPAPPQPTAPTHGTDTGTGHMTGFEQSLNGMSWADMATMVSQCQRCRLAPTRTRTVFGSGSTNPLIAFVGEGPGAEEDRQGEPFVGAAGHLLTRMLFALGLSREDVYIVNVVKCRPPGNRNPLPDEIAACEGYLFQQLTLLEPRIIVALGRFAILSLLGETGSVAAMRNRKDYTWRNIPVLPTYHPAFYLRQPSRKRDAWEDLLRLQAQLARMGYPIGHGQPSGHFLPALSPLLSPAAGTVGSAEPIAVAPGGC